MLLSNEVGIFTTQFPTGGDSDLLQDILSVSYLKQVIISKKRLIYKHTCLMTIIVILYYYLSHAVQETLIM